eukprot:gene12837-8731_t
MRATGVEPAGWRGGGPAGPRAAGPRPQRGKFGRLPPVYQIEVEPAGWRGGGPAGAPGGRPAAPARAPSGENLADCRPYIRLRVAAFNWMQKSRARAKMGSICTFYSTGWSRLGGGGGSGRGPRAAGPRPRTKHGKFGRLPPVYQIEGSRI